ncbi:MAG: hypothetical protein KA761_10380, partial [Gemmatimonadaceae bacterium]|nr:hypothetical protein [Gemmatimonadaceae bacterium]
CPHALLSPSTRPPALRANDGLHGSLELRVYLPLNALEVNVNPDEGTSGAFPPGKALRERIGLPKRQSQALRELGAQ